MKHLFGRTMIVVFVFVGLAVPAHAQKPAIDQFPSAAGVTLDLGGSCSDNPTLMLTGPTIVQRGAPAEGVIQTEILSMELRGLDPNGLNVTLRAGAQHGLPPSLGQVTLGREGPPHASFFDVFFEVELGDGSRVFNEQPVRMASPINTIPPISHTFTNVNQVNVFNRSNSNNVGQVDVLWHHPARPGKETKLGVSLNVQGSVDLGLLSAGVCPPNALPSATYDLRRQTLVGLLSPNTTCNEVNFNCEGEALFEAFLDSNLRAPDWRGGHRGTWRIVCNGIVLAQGKLDGCNGIGTHRRPPLDKNCEDCNPCNHFEGRLLGVVVAPGIHRGAKIEACYAGEYVDEAGDPISCCPLPCFPPNGPVRMAIDGIALHKCLFPQ